jgi:Ca2+/H+ antiporter, TMEM165/GDT1 family
MTKKKWLALIFIGPPAIALFIWIGGELVMHLWNWLTPTLFGWRQITFWQAFGLLALCRILVGGHGVRGSNRSEGRRRIKERMDERWEKMTPEEREKFRQSWRGRCAGFEPPRGETPTGEAKGPA